jgi:hypothetical protein
VVFDFSRLINISRGLQQSGGSYLVFCIDDNSITGNAICFWTGVFNNECDLSNLVDYWLLSILESGHRTKKMP